MKKFFFLFSFFAITFSCFAQNSLPKAYLTSELYIMLDGENPADAKVFEADMTEFGFTSLEQANRFFSFFNDPTVIFEINMATKKVVITLIPSTDRQNWTLTEWQTYFKNKIVEQRNQLGYVDFTTR